MLRFDATVAARGRLAERALPEGDGTDVACGRLSARVGDLACVLPSTGGGSSTTTSTHVSNTRGRYEQYVEQRDCGHRE